MTEKKISLYHLHKRTGITRRHLERILKESSNPTFHNICAIAKALGVELKELLEFDQSVGTDWMPKNVNIHYFERNVPRSNN